MMTEARKSSFLDIKNFQMNFRPNYLIKWHIILLLNTRWPNAYTPKINLLIYWLKGIVEL